MSTAYIIGSVPFPADSERQSVLCALVSASRLWLSSPNCQMLAQWRHIADGASHLVISCRADPCGPQDIDSFCFTSVFTSGWAFWVTALAQWAPLSPWFPLQVRTERPLHLFSSPGPLSAPWADFMGPVSSPVAADSEAVSLHQGTQLLPGRPRSCRSMSACLLLTCACPDLWVLECQRAHVAKESSLLEALGLQILRTQGGFLTLALYQLHVF